MRLAALIIAGLILGACGVVLLATWACFDESVTGAMTGGANDDE